MNEFLGVFRYEYRMSIRRWGLWLTFGLLMIPYLTSMFTPPAMDTLAPTQENIFSYAGTFAFSLNLFMPVVGGILAADRLVRDRKIGVDELLRSTALHRWTYLAAKYLAVVCSITTPVLLTALGLGVMAVANGAPLTILLAMLLAFLTINLPAYIFIIAFSLACPLVIPLRVYQVLFTGYWFWGNFLSPEFFPTLNGTYLTAAGTFALDGLFGGFYGGGGPNYVPTLTPLDAAINLAVLAACAGLALLTAERYLAWQTGRA